MTAVLNIVLLSLAGLSLLVALYFVSKALGARSNVNRQAYNVGQVEAKRDSQVNWLRAAFSLIIGLIFVGVFAVRPLISPRQTPAPAPTLPASDVDIAPTQAVTLTPTQPTAEPQPTSPPASPSPEATAAPTATTAPVTATVSSGVGVWLRGAPNTSGEQIEWLLDGTIVTLLGGQETADDLVWQQVVTEGGVEGWVASDFLALGEPGP
ncbi:MAG: SH3 domain-containing protein [Candidatus Promineofilum sp.]|nr:SH3 domain-containing protein [Promineifilum sp.]